MSVRETNDPALHEFPAALQAGLGWSKARGYTRKCTGSGAPLGGFSRTAPVSDSSCSETGTKRIGSSFPFDPASVTERGTLEPGQPSVPIPLAQAFGTLESGLQRSRKTLSKNHGTRQLQVISSDRLA